jgi:hypothetical protein
VWPSQPFSAYRRRAKTRRARTFPVLMDGSRTIHRYRSFGGAIEARQWLAKYEGVRVTVADSHGSGIVASRHARRTAEYCGRCGSAFEPDETIWRLTVPHVITPYVRRWRLSVCCSGCTPDRRQRERCVRPCEHCGRPVGVLPGRRTFCSDRCTWSWYNAQRNARTAVERLARPQCRGCGKRFIQTRSDATTCSPACRQRVYRQRRAV